MTVKFKKLKDDEIKKLLGKQVEYKRYWTEEEDDEFVRLVDSGLNARSIFEAKVFPGRNLSGIKARWARLKQEGRIKE
jgi:hypothetical protein